MVYKVVPTEQMQGLIEFVSDAVTVCKVQLPRRPEIPRINNCLHLSGAGPGGQEKRHRGPGQVPVLMQN